MSIVIPISYIIANLLIISTGFMMLMIHEKKIKWYWPVGLFLLTGYINGTLSLQMTILRFTMIYIAIIYLCILCVSLVSTCFCSNRLTRYEHDPEDYKYDSEDYEYDSEDSDLEDLQYST